MKGKFIVLEGVDGSGISTQIGLLKNWFEKNKLQIGKAYFTKEPTDGPVGGLIRLALTKRLKPLDERVMALLFAADRMDHLYRTGAGEQKEGIASLLEKGIHVVSDRYYLSSLAYQSVQTDLSWLLAINREIIKPDLTILLQVPAAESAERRHKSRIHEELYENEKSLAVISRNYEDIAHRLIGEGENIIMVDGTQDIDTVFHEITGAVSALFQVPVKQGERS